MLTNAEVVSTNQFVFMSNIIAIVNFRWLFNMPKTIYFIKEEILKYFLFEMKGKAFSKNSRY